MGLESGLLSFVVDSDEVAELYCTVVMPASCSF